MKIVGTIHAPAQLAISLRQSVIEYCGNHEDGNVRAAVLDLRVCSCNAMIVHHWISLATPLGVELSAAALRAYIKTDERANLSNDSEVTVSMIQGDIA